ncbi:hypothetical protein UFOVP847_32 [uncultured Caudovirales phage]|uniref:Uncharacterized protein n=1 Tax=uncultured Caudovirales phage TaxID=2100421 RepID=A0A6J5P5M1_9CAUD|nr:hypothetical protein UFOVP847_32 [uncultured Caudovirales phage]
MATGDTDVSICSDALVMLGASVISSLTEGTPAATACNRLYPDIRDSLLSSYAWSWSVQKVQLSRLSTAPTNEWRYAYQLPSNMLSGALAVFDSGASTARPINYGWEIYGSQLFTNMAVVYIDYQSTVGEVSMPPYFVRLLKTAVAGEIAMVITDQASKAEYYRAVAFGSLGENNRGGLFREAVNIDSRGQLSKTIEDFSLISVRY